MDLNEHQAWVKSTLGVAYPYVNQGLADAVARLVNAARSLYETDVLSRYSFYELLEDVEAELAAQQRINAVLYCALGLAGEAGEVANKAKKVLRDDGGELTPERRSALAKELGGTLWYLAQACTALGLDLGQVAAGNRREIEGRIARGTLKGDGDDR